MHASLSLPTPMKFLLLIAMLNIAATAADWPRIMYPPTRKEDVTDEYHGTKITDPYRWLEDDNSAETKAWVTEQNRLTSAFLGTIARRPQIRARLAKLWNFERYGEPFERGGRYFWTYNSGLQNQRVLYTADKLDAPPRVLLDPNTLSADGTVSLKDTAPSEDGKLLAYGLSRAGSDWEEFRVRDTVTGKDREDLIQWVKFSGASWMKDGSGFFYSRFDEPKTGDELKGKVEFQKLYFHKLGTPQSADTLIYERKDHGDWGFHGSVTDDGRWLVIHVTQGTDTKNRVFYKDLTQPDAKVVELLNDFDADYSFVDNVGPVFLFQTDLDAPRYRVIAVDTRTPQRANWRELIPQAAEKLDGVGSVGGKLFCKYLKDARSEVRVFAPKEDRASPPSVLNVQLERALVLPGIGTVGGFGGRAGDTHTFFSFASFTEPGAIYRLEVATLEYAVWKKPKVDFKSADYETKQVFLQSKDGTRVPMFITHKRGLVLDGNAPVILYGYGGFNISLTPAFSVSRAVWLEMGGVFAVANLRGGGEYGAEWHKAGTKLKKQNVFDDFIAAAEWLISNKYTRAGKARDPGRQQRRPARRSGDDAAPGTFRGGHSGRRRDGHAALPQVHHRLGVEERLRQRRNPGRFQGAARLLAVPQPQARHALPRDARDDRRPRRPRRPRAQLQVRRAPAGVPGHRWSACDDPHRDERGPRRRNRAHQGDGRDRRRVGLPHEGPRDAVADGGRMAASASSHFHVSLPTYPICT